MAAAYPEFLSRNTALVAISTDEVDGASDMADHAGTVFPILADPGGGVTRQYGVYNLLGDGVATPATFIVGKDGIIQERYVGKDIADRLSAEQILRLLDQIEN